MKTISRPNNTLLAYTAMGSTALAYALLGGLTLWYGFQPLLKYGVGEYHLVMSAIFFTAWAVGFKKLSYWPLAIGFSIFIIDALCMFRSIYILNGKTYVFPFLVWGYIAYHWLKGVRETA